MTHRHTPLALAALLAALLPTPGPAAAQAPDSLITMPAGGSVVLESKRDLERVAVSDPEVARAVAVSNREILLNAKGLGTTYARFWETDGTRRSFQIEVVTDVGPVQRQIDRMFPDADITVEAVGSTVVLSGRAPSGQVVRKARTITESLAAPERIVDDVEVPEPGQVLLQVRFAEVNRSALRKLGAQLLRVNPANPTGDDQAGIGAGGPAVSGEFLDGDGPTTTFSDAVNFFLFHDASNLGAFIQGLRSDGHFKSLAEPNLLAVPGDSASFLAGGEFPFPVVQGGSGSESISVEFREFGVRLNFTPTFTNSGAIRLHVAPEVSTLDFSSGLEVSGHRIPSINSRRAETTIELADGQTFAIAGLIDSKMSKSVSKVPVLGDIPILGKLFQSEEMRQNRTELLVLVTPRIVHPTDREPALPTGEPKEWGWSEQMVPDSTRPDPWAQPAAPLPYDPEGHLPFGGRGPREGDGS